MQLDFKLPWNKVFILFDQQKYLDLFWTNLEATLNWDSSVWFCPDVFPLQAFQWEMKNLHVLCSGFGIVFADCFALYLSSLDTCLFFAL